MIPRFPLINQPTSRRTILLSISMMPLLLAACTKIIPDTQTPQQLTSLLQRARTDISFILNYLSSTEQIHLSHQAQTYLKAALKVRREQEQFLITASHSSISPITSAQLPQTQNPNELTWQNIITQLHQSSDHAKNLCLVAEGEVSAIAASICAACMTLITFLSHMEKPV